jgi:hypothetical protein
MEQLEDQHSNMRHRLTADLIKIKTLSSYSAHWQKVKERLRGILIVFSFNFNGFYLPANIALYNNPDRCVSPIVVR